VLDHDPAALRGDVVAHDPAAVSGQAVPDDKQLAADVALEVREELDDLGPFDRAGEEPEVEIPPRDPGDRGEQVPVEVVPEDRRLSPGGPGAAPMRPLGQSALVDEDDRSPWAAAFFLTPASARASSGGSPLRRVPGGDPSGAGNSSRGV
jgi:hypothetical protein